ncbi:hypothetical protein IKP85_03550 [bacterium]|nr:hypothetical protein [bacterium]
MDNKVSPRIDYPSFTGSVNYTKGLMKNACEYLTNAELTGESRKEIIQFINTIRAIYKDQTSNVLTLERKAIPRNKGIFSQLADGDMFVLTYGNQYKSSTRVGEDVQRGAFWEVLKFGRNHFGEDMLNEPIKDIKEFELYRMKLASLRVQQANIQKNIDLLTKNVLSFLIK